jgi:PAS domain S-box-containing protein
VEREVSVAEDIFAGGGEIGGLMRSRDWSQTPLGAVKNWPSSLKTAVRQILGDPYPMFLWWGEHLTNFYNDAAITALGKQHPEALGRSASEVWAQIWDTIGPQTAAVLHEGRSTWNRELLLIVERNRYPEETYFTFSCRPASSDGGKVAGVFCTCIEDTQRVLGDRRFAALRELAAATIATKTPAAACEISAAALSSNPDIPFALFYLLEDGGRSAKLASTIGLAAGTIASPESIDLTSATTPDNWQLQPAIAAGKTQIVEDLETKFGLLPGGGGAQSPRTAAVIPLVRSPETLGVIILGVSPLRALDGDLRGFFDLVAGQVTTAIANARAYQQQQHATALAELDRAKTTFLGNTSNEFRESLTLMLGAIEDCLTDRASPLPAQHRERLEVLQRNGLRLQELVSTLWDFSHLEAGTIAAVGAPTNLAAFTAELASLFRSAIEPPNLCLKVDRPPPSAPSFQIESILSSIRDGFFVLDRDWRYTYTNHRYCEIFGMRREQVLGRCIWDIFSDTVNTELWVEFDRALREQTPVQFEYFYPTWQRWFDLRVSPWNGGLSVFAIDITQRQKTAAALANSQQQLQSLIDAIPHAIWVIGASQEFRFSNLQWLKYYGVSFTEAMASGWERVHPDDKNSIQQQWETAIAAGVPYETEFRWRHCDGVDRWYLCRAVPLKDESGQIVEWVGTNTDITALKQTEAALQESQRFNQQVAETLPGLLSVYDAIEQRHVYINPQVGELLGYTAEQMLEMGSEVIPKTVHPDDIPQIAAHLERCNASRPPEALEVEIRLQNARGQWRWFLSRSVVFSRTPEGKVRQLLGVGIDVTDRKRIEQQLRQTNQTLTTLIAASPLAIALIKPDAEVKLWNQAAESLFGWSESEVLGRPIPIVSEEQLNECLQLRAAVAGGETFLGMETYRQKRDGSKVIVSLSAAPLYGDNGGVSEIVVIFQDITAQKRAEAALRQLNKRFQGAMQAVDGIVFEWNLPENSVYRSEGLFQLLGVKPEDADPTSEWWGQRIHPDDLIYLQSKLASITSADRYQDEYRVRHQDGSWVDVWERGCLQRDEHGKIIAVVGFTTNITDRKLALSQLQESEERYRYLVESIPQLVWTADIQGNLLDVNQRWSTYTGLTLDRVPAEGWQAIVHPEDLPELTARWRAAQQAGSDYQAEGRLRRCDGTYRWHLHQAIPIADECGQVTRWFGTATDIQDRKQAEAALRASEELFRNLADNAPFMVWVTDPTGYCTYLSQSWYDFTGETEASSLGFGWLNVTHPEDRESADRAFLAANDRREPFCLEYRLRRFDGEYIWAIDAASPRFGAGGEFQGYVGSVIDITQRKAAEAERDRVLEQEKAARAEAEKANRIKDEFLAVLSHELRSPLNPILGWSKLLQSGRLDPQKTKLALETIERNARLQTQLIEDLLDVSRILQGKLVLNQVPVPLTNTVEAAMETVKLAAEAKGIQIQKSLNLPAGKILGDSARLQQVIWNLLSNAIKFSPAGGSVEIRLEQMDTCAQIQVIDGGKGIKPEFLPYVFEYFRQEDGTTTRKFGGLGLGLAIVRYLTELHGGTVGAESLGEGLGATFTVRFPLIQASTQTPRDNSPATSTIDLTGLQILVVDDEPDIRDIVSFILEDAGAEVSIASSALEALNSIEQSLPDVLVCDIGMPDMDGYMLMRLLRRQSLDRGGEIPAIALTAYAGEVDRQGAISAGFQRHLAKPADPDELIAAVKNLVS